jgi:SAM-dependent methyltransferase
MELVPGYFTTSNMQGCFSVWDSIRQGRQLLSYDGKTVLDIGSMDGMWAFEAEKLGAKTVVSADIYQKTDGARVYERAMIAREAFGSRVVFVPNGDAHRLYDRLDSIRNAWSIGAGFDIVQCLGLLYHLQNPLLALRNIRRCMSDSGFMLLETACYIDEEKAPMMRGNWDNGIYYDPSTYWSQNIVCLKDMLRETGFEPMYAARPADRLDRIIMVCRALPINRVDAFGLVA